MPANTSEQVSVSTTPGHTPAYYHTRDCRNAPTRDREISRGEARRRGLEQCPFCADPGQDVGGAPNNKYLRKLGVGVND